MDRSLSSPGSLARRIAACIGTLLLVLPLLGLQDAGAQAPASDEVVIFVLDLSGSMNEPFDASRTKLDVAKAAFVEAFANVSPEARVGVRTYGDQLAPTDPASREASCTTDTRVVTSVAPLQRDQLISQVQGFTALGDTPMGLALESASGDIPAGSTGTIVLFSDGRDECFDADLDGDPAVGPSYGQDPCAIAKAITAGDAAVDRVVTVGFRADAAAETELRCIADSTGGTYTAIETPEDARDALPELLVQLSAPREAQRLVGQAIKGATTTEDAPDLVRLDEIFANKVLYTDSIDMNSVRIYRVPLYGPEGGTFTATVFGLPAELGIALDMRIYIPSLDQRFFLGEHGNFDAGLPASPTTSIRCTDCKISGGPYEAFFTVTLDTENPTITGTYELEILTEGPGFGGPTTSCSAPQACFYPQEIIDQRAAIETIQAELDAGVGVPAPADLIAERDRLRDEFRDAQDAIAAADTRAAEIEAQIATAPPISKSFRLPLLMIVAGVALAFAPVQKLKRDPKEPDAAVDAGGDEKKPDRKTLRRQRAKEEAEKAVASTSDQNNGTDKASEGSPIAMSAPTGNGPSLDVGPAPAISPNLKESGNHWDAELEAAKEAMAQQRPSRAEAATETTAAAPTAGPPQGQFSAAQHAAAKAAAQQIAAQRAQEIDAGKALDTPGPVAAPHDFSSPQTPPQPAASVQAATPEQIAALRAAAAEPVPATQSPPAPDEAATGPEQSAAEQAATEAAAQAATERATAERQAAQQAATAERDAAERATAERQAAQQAATAERDAAERATAERATAEREAAQQAATEQAAADQAAIKAAEQAAQQATARAATEQAAAEAAAREAADRATEEQELRAAAEARAVQVAAERAAAEKAEADRLAAEQIAAAERAAAEQAARLAAEQAAAEQAEREAAEQAAAEQAARLAAEQAAREQAAREAAERAAADRAAAELAARLAAEQAAREAAEQAAREQAAREAAERAAAEQAAREQAAREAAEIAAAEQAARERAEREAAERAAADRAAAERAARLAAERLAAEKEAAQRAAAERAASEQAALEAAERAAADRAAAEQAVRDRAVAEQAARDAAARLATETAAAEKAAADRAAAEEAAREAAIQRAATEEAALKAAAERAAQEAAAEAASFVDDASDGEQKQSLTEEEQRQEARRRMLAKQNIVASSSSDGSSGATTRPDTAGTSAALRPMTVPPTASPSTSRAERGTPEAPGWYDDPAIVGQFRWWDGGTWTGQTAADDQGAPPG